MWLPETKKSIALSLTYDPEQQLLVQNGSGAPYFDDWEYAKKMYGEQYGATDYAYAESMQLLEKNNFEQARQIYDKFMAAHPGGREINDFEYEWANRLAREDLDAALSFVEEQEASETDEYRKSHFGYLKGELLIKHEQPERGRNALRKALKKYAKSSGDEEDTQVIQYTRTALALSLIESENRDTSKAGYRQVQMQLFNNKDKKGKKILLRRLMHYSKEHYEKGYYRQHMDSLLTLTGEREREELLTQWAEQELTWGDASKALSLADSVEKTHFRGNNRQQSGDKKRNSRKEIATELIKLEAYLELRNLDKFEELFTSLDEQTLRGRDRAKYNKLKKRYEQLTK